MWWTVNKYDEWNFSDDNIPFPIHKVTYRHISKSRTLAKKNLTVAGLRLCNVTAKLMECYIFTQSAWSCAIMNSLDTLINT